MKVFWINEIMNILQTNNQRKVKNKKAAVQLNMRQLYAQYVKETLNLQRFNSTPKNADHVKATII